jgi:hypothetical protein
MAGWPELRFYGRAKTDGHIWYYEERQQDGSVMKRPLQPYETLVRQGSCA